MTSTIDEETIHFVKLKVACSQALEATSSENIERLTNILKITPKPVIQKMQIYIIFVLTQILQQKELRSKYKIDIIEGLRQIFINSEFSKIDPVLNNLMLCLMSLMYNPESDNLVADQPEELHLGCIKCVSLILSQIKETDLVYLYSPKQAPMLGVLVCICLKQATVQQLRTLRVAAIECIMICAQVLKSSYIYDEELRHKTANVFMNFLPGIAAGLQQVINGDEKQGHAVVVVALRAWGRLLAQILDDEALPTDENLVPLNQCDTNSEFCVQQNNAFTSAKTSSDLEQVMSKSKRSRSWFAYADSKLLGNVRSVCLTHQHSHPKVRIELATTAELLIIKCSRSLSLCLPPLLEVVLILSEDSVEEVSTVGKAALEKLELKCSEESSRSLTEHLEESFFTLISSLPSKFIHAELQQQKAQLNLLLGHLKVLGRQLSEVLLLSAHWEALLHGLLQVATLDCGTVVTLLESANRTLSLTETGNLRQWCQFKYFSDSSILKQLVLVCQILGEKTDLSLLTSQLLIVFTDKPKQRAEAALLLNLILGTSYPDKTDVQLNSVQDVLKIYLDNQFWNVPLIVEDSDTPVTLSAVRRNIVQTCILTEGVALLAAATGSKCRRFLAYILYPILERAGSQLELVAHAGLLALNVIASVLGHDSPMQLIREEANYFTHAVAVGLRCPQDNPGSLLVLSAVLAHSNSDILPHIETIIEDTLARSCDMYYEQNLRAYLQIFYTFVCNVKRWLSENQYEIITQPVDKNKTISMSMSLMVQELLTHHKWKLETGENESDTEINDPEQIQCDSAMEEILEKEPKKVPNYIKMTEAVMQRCTHTLPSSNQDNQLMALRILTIGIKILSSHEDQLLPMVHRIWSPLLQRFLPSQNIVVLRYSFELLCTMIHVSQSFLRKRTLGNVLPSICSFLKKQAEVTRKQRVEVFSQGYKFQKQLLDHLGQLCVDLQLQEEDIDTVLLAASPYLSSEQPIELQESCVKLFHELIKINTEAVWLHLQRLWTSQTELQSPHSSCRLIRFPNSSTQDHVYKRNVELLLSRL